MELNPSEREQEFRVFFWFAHSNIFLSVRIMVKGEMVLQRQDSVPYYLLLVGNKYFSISYSSDTDTQ